MFNYSRYNCKRNFAFQAHGCRDYGGCSYNDNCALPFERIELWDSIDLKLKFACIRGFRGKEQEVQFANMNQKLEDNYWKWGAYKTLKINLIFNSVNTIIPKEMMTPSN